MVSVFMKDRMDVNQMERVHNIMWPVLSGVCVCVCLCVGMCVCAHVCAWVRACSAWGFLKFRHRYNSQRIIYIFINRSLNE